uniref:Uncharacterized protein n=1 Tax=viral metagenome TaxID=1070528 RepID=A0A6M3KD96_9ZZZZ
MCNKVHRTIKDTEKVTYNGHRPNWNPKFRKIKPKGIGYKLFNVKDSMLVPLYQYNPYSMNGKPVHPREEKIVWNNVWEGDGFCFFKSKQEAVKVKGSDHTNYRIVVRKIAYEQGIGTFSTPEVTGYMIRCAIAKVFKVID